MGVGGLVLSSSQKKLETSKTLLPPCFRCVLCPEWFWPSSPIPRGTLRTVPSAALTTLTPLIKGVEVHPSI